MVGACKPTFLSSFFLVDGCNNFVEICHCLAPYGLFQSMILDYLGLCHSSLDFKFVHVFGVYLISLCNDKCPFSIFKNYQ